ncbi:MAG: alpha/beta hydrolase [Flavobacteriaceae bacterium]|nr:alpha/beta hydrolase [Flavobacteriaceae bacterium]
MKQSLTHQITLLIIKIKGLKKTFSKDPIDFKKIRKEDVRYPKGRFFKKNKTRNFRVLDSLITEIGMNAKSDKLLIFIHGGAFISGPARHHWDSVKKIAKQTNHKIWMCDYPKSPENKISKISENIDSIYYHALEQFKSNKIYFIGDSVGGTLITSLTQRLILKSMELPKKIILVTPVMDSSLSNPEIIKVDDIDPMLSKTGVLSAKKMCAENNDLKNIMISPLFGSFDKFPHTILFLAENDIFYPDQKILVKKLINAKINFELIEGKNMPHIWPFLPVMKEAKIALNQIINNINK